MSEEEGERAQLVSLDGLVRRIPAIAHYLE